MKDEGYSLALGVVLLLFGCVGCGNPPGDAVDTESPAAVTDGNYLGESVKEAEGQPASQSQAPEAETPVQEARVAPTDLPKPLALSPVDWPQYRGQARDGISKVTGLASTWSDDGPPIVWQTNVGKGYAAPSVVGDRVYLNDYDEETSKWMVRCLSLQDGQEHWRYQVKKRIRANHGITRSAPATDGGFVFSIDPKCEVHCLDARNGGLIWKKFLPAEYDSQIPAWYNGQCPLIDGDRLVIATGGRVLITALEKSTGEPIWEAENEQELPLSHSSIMPVEIDGVRQYTYTTLEGVDGVDAETGKALWHFPWKFNTAVSTSPLPLGEGKFFLTAGYHAQSVICQAKRDGDGWIAEEVVALPAPTVGWNSEVHTPIFYRGNLYGIGKKRRGLWTCLDLEGNTLWDSKGQASFGMGGYVLADGKFFVLEGKTGMLRVLDAEVDEYRELASFRLLRGPDAWAPPIIVKNKLLIRDFTKLLCLEIGEQAQHIAFTK